MENPIAKWSHEEALRFVGSFDGPIDPLPPRFTTSSEARFGTSERFEPQGGSEATPRVREGTHWGTRWPRESPRERAS